MQSSPFIFAMHGTRAVADSCVLQLPLEPWDDSWKHVGYEQQTPISSQYAISNGINNIMGGKIPTKKIVCWPNIQGIKTTGLLIGCCSLHICGKSAFKLWEFLPNNLCFGPSQSLAALRGWVWFVGSGLFYTRNSHGQKPCVILVY